MTLYEIDEAIMNCFDLLTGEIIDADQYEALQIERDAKLEQVALWIKNLEADITAIDNEIKAFNERKTHMRTKADSLKKWLTNSLQGEKINTAKVSVGFRKSEALEVEDEHMLIDYAKQNGMLDLLVFKDPTIDKAFCKSAIKNGVDIPGVKIVERQNIHIK